MRERKGEEGTRSRFTPPPPGEDEEERTIDLESPPPGFAAAAADAADSNRRRCCIRRRRDQRRRSVAVRHAAAVGPGSDGRRLPANAADLTRRRPLGFLPQRRRHRVHRFGDPRSPPEDRWFAARLTTARR